MSLIEPLVILGNLTVVIIVGIAATIIASKVKIPNILFLLIGGLLVSLAQPLLGLSFDFSGTFLIGLAIITLTIVVFDGASRLELKRVEQFSLTTSKLTITFLVLNIIFTTVLANYFIYGRFTLETFLFSSILAVTLSGTDPTSVFNLLKRKNTTFQILKLEAILNTPLIVLLPILATTIIQTTSIENSVYETIQLALSQNVIPLLLQISAGIGIGLLAGFILTHTINKNHLKDLNPLILMIGAIGCYLLAETMGGNGVFAAATMGLIFGNIQRKTIAQSEETEQLQDINSVMGSSLLIIIFPLVGLLIPTDMSLELILKGAVLFIVALTLRYISIRITFKELNIPLREQIFATLTMPKGVAVAVVVLNLIVLSQTNNLVEPITQLILLTMLFSIILATITAKNINRFFPEMAEPAVVNKK